ncbi:MAG: LPS export ABC transporter periplasmic protein LptC [Flavobacteriaceae bacterium]|nr:LPS export ABC transporter periplasmic protein LptC [Candidatus Onthonaster equi]
MKLHISILMIFVSLMTLAQQTPKKSKLNLKNFDVAERNPTDYEGNQLLHGNVMLEYNGDLLYCDSAVYYQNKDKAIVWSNVRLVSKDKTITAKKMEYDATTTIVKAWDNVKFKDATSSVDADFMEYNRTSEIAHALGNVVVRSPGNNIDSNEIFYNRKSETVTVPGNYKTIDADGTIVEGKDVVYNVGNKSAVFNAEVYITSKDYMIYSRKMTTNDKTGVTTFRDYSKITSRKDPSQYVITKDGDFNKKTGEAWLRNFSEIFYQGKKLTAKSIYVNEKTGYGKATDSVFIDDPEQKMFIRGDFAEAFRNQDSAYVTKNAYAVRAFEKDSLYIHADTLMVVRRPDKDSTTLVRAYHNARFYKSNINGKTDSLVYNRTNGEMEFHKDPLLFSGENQISGKFIKLYTNPKTNKLDSINILENAFAISKVDSLKENEFNQIKGKDMTAIFYEDQIDFLRVVGNAVALSYMDDEDEKTKVKERYGIDITYCGIIEADVVSKQMELIACRIKASGKTYPESKFPEDLRYLPDFKWRFSESLKKWQDIFQTKSD